MEEITIQKALEKDIPEITEFYDTLCQWLEDAGNPPRWQKGVYPNNDTAWEGTKAGACYLLRVGRSLAGTVILNTEQPEAYKTVNWQFPAPENGALVVHTLAVSPQFSGLGLGSRLLALAERVAKEQLLLAIRLDAYEHNLPAIALYQKNGYRKAGLCDLGLPFLEPRLFLCMEKNMGNG